MSGRYKAYGEYRVVKLNGIEKLPSLWEIKQVRYLLKDGYEGIKIGPFGSALKLDDMVEEGVRVYGQENIINKDFSLGSRNISFNKYKDMVCYGVSVGDILITLMGTSGKCEIFPYEAKKGIIDSHLLRIRVNKKIIIPRFFKLLIDESPEIKHQMLIQGKGSIMHGLNSGVIKGLNLPLPTFLEQKLILNFLDHETAKIDILIEKQQQLIELLKEKRQAVISHAVTKGLDPEVPMKDSGVEWLGEVPIDWDIMRLKFVVSLYSEKMFVSNSVYVGLENISSGSGKYSFKEDAVPDGMSLPFRKGDVLFGKLRPYLAKSWLATFSGVCSSEFLILRTNKLHSKFLNYFSLAKEFIEQVNSATYGSKMPRANWEFIGLLPVPKCSYELSESIAAFLDHETSKIDTLIELQQQQINLLKERRTALISAAVTGKIDVRDWQVHVTQTESDEVMA
ncbi:restriction endonuclease subunit S [Rahnella sp. BCC 1045]|uniref:restriction endonuclease subunit S n=1 Tax=Rahnella sp. BCC 1045 TaxID=2816251 RepID=UPI001C26B4FE|nr:restriction endonuclease subunit S [Rahnella sp. BCC 1045]MBU9819130.1 restriction endonuclease subunit S [Rahnella sp. BCC 1045]